MAKRSKKADSAPEPSALKHRAHMSAEHRAKMADDIKQFTGDSAEMSARRPTRKILRHHQQAL
jgi:hypothetical protein